MIASGVILVRRWWLMLALVIACAGGSSPGEPWVEWSRPDILRRAGRRRSFLAMLGAMGFYLLAARDWLGFMPVTAVALALLALFLWFVRAWRCLALPVALGMRAAGALVLRAR